jgi:hypothetical protein
MHGNSLVVYSKDNRTVLTDKIKEGHALACADFFGQGRDQVVMGWRNPNVIGETGLRIFVGSDPEGKKWQEYVWMKRSRSLAKIYYRLIWMEMVIWTLSPPVGRRTMSWCTGTNVRNDIDFSVDLKLAA